ncbi:MAG TPA: methionine--tRNA ligase [Caulobacteraceae bacterium]|jgi:methionyl-tRNA synthetase
MARILITSALPGINGVKHLGNLVGSLLPSDVYGRFQRYRGNEVLLICGTDDHGTPAELAAAELGQDIADYCAEQYRVQNELGLAYGLSFDLFGRTHSPGTGELVHHFAAALEAHGLIEERVDKMVYSLADKRFLPDRYVEGTCPVCGFRPARGDQCDNCGSLLDPVDLIDPYSVISGSPEIEVRDTRHLYQLHSRMADRVRAWADSKTEWATLPRAITNKHLDEGLIDRGITRDLAWGFPVLKDGRPRPGFETKVYYVWFDDVLGYIGITRDWAAEHGADWERWWRLDKGADDVRYVQFMGKDNVPFHSVYFPSTILGSQEPWKTVDVLKAFNWLNWYGGKFSTSQKRGVFMDQALELLPADCWRWYLTANSPEGSDTVFTWEVFVSAVNRDLADVFGNFVNRITRFCEARFEGVVPAGGEPGPLEQKLYADVAVAVGELTAQLDAIEMRKSAQALRALWVLGNEYLQEAAPWTAIRTDPERAAVVVRTGLNLVSLFARAAAPFIPFAAETVLAAVGEPVPPAWPTTDIAVELARLPPGRRIAAPPVLFRKIEDAEVAAWTQRFGGAG